MPMPIYSEYKLVYLSRVTVPKVLKFCILFQQFYFSRMFPLEIIINLTTTRATAILVMIPQISRH